ncbi:MULTISPECIES: LacI family DNA-binding transcriptional regulator [unclassified Roseateles]|uniref:LacI family DNA-binding transcriptional regulator n=1 Tax=unclassified Roseateles TaxID=2626991 RepID=UPI0006F7CE32|nr:MULTISPECIES: LacI family DNA-binding transcriptional regulator [unclassified Roseateles]KQW42344.1 LacI family transcriptional regulator [Pelomonas sp. Root405]KRA68218.1 LacI family transcriptional regulator [Pelomonas sp. Root662]
MPKSKASPSSTDTSTSEQRRLQMVDIARLAGVSVSTVSRALNGSELVNAETRQRVAELARSLNYSINLGARNLRLQENRTIAVVVPYDAKSRQHISDPFFLSIVGSIADALTDRGYDMLLSRVDAERLDLAAGWFDSGKAIGVVLIGQWRHHDQLNEMAARKLPLVVWGGELPQQLYCSVGGDNVLGGTLATRHLLQLGRRRIAFVGDAHLPEVWLRRQGYAQALREAGLAVDAGLEVAAPFEPGVATGVLQQFCAMRRDFDAVVCCSDVLALLTIQALRAGGRSVPGDVAVIGYDDMPLAAYCEPPLTTVHQPVAEAGIELVEALLAQLRGQRAEPRTMPVYLKLRESAPQTEG